MKLMGIEIYQFNLPLIKPLQMKGNILNNRQGLLICFINDQNQLGYGEIAPFPNLHKEDFDKAKHQLLMARDELKGQHIPDNLELLSGGFDKWLVQYNFAPSVRFGIETGILNLMSQARGQTLAYILNNNCRKSISINGLITGSISDMEYECRRLLKEGYKTIKLKVGQKSIEDDIQIVKMAKEILGSGIKLRLDANRAWPLERAIIFGKAVFDCQIEYIEEPLFDFSQNLRFFKETNIPIGLDETLLDIKKFDDLYDIEKFDKGIRAFILKPSLLNGLDKTVSLANYAKEHGIIPVISSTFHSGIGLSAEANLAASINTRDIAVGLDTYKWFREDLLKSRFQAKNGEVNLDIINENSKNIRLDLLERVD